MTKQTDLDHLATYLEHAVLTGESVIFNYKGTSFEVKVAV